VVQQLTHGYERHNVSPKKPTYCGIEFVRRRSAPNYSVSN
jgi:hypothetical protein